MLTAPRAGGANADAPAPARRDPGRSPAELMEAPLPPLAGTRSALAAARLLAACSQASGELELVGTVERTQIELVAPVSEAIVAIDARRGQRVGKGRLLVQLDATFARAEVARAEAGLASARTAVLVANQEAERVRRLRQSKVASDQDLDRATLGRDEAAARRRDAEAQLDAARKRLA